MIILAFSSFEKFNFLRVENLTMIDNDFSVSFLKGKTYRELRYGVIPSIPSKDFDPANIFSIYLDKVALLHAEGNSNIYLKMASLSQNMVRHMRNTSERVTIEERIRVVNCFTKKLANSGYTRDQARRVVEAGLKGYEKAKRKATKSGKRMHRSAKSGAAARNMKKLLAKTSWYKESVGSSEDGSSKDGSSEDGEEKETGARYLFTPPRNGAGKVSGVMRPWSDSEDQQDGERRRTAKRATPLTTVLFIEQTPGGVYASRMREKEEILAGITGYRIKIIEKSGTTLKSLLVKSNPWAGGKCGRSKCLPCDSGVQESKCSKRNVLYESTCRECLAMGEDFTYVGESSRSAYERAINHIDAYRDKHTDSHMYNHSLDKHNGRMDVKWNFVVIKTFQKALTRQISEAVRTRTPYS